AAQRIRLGAWSGSVSANSVIVARARGVRSSGVLPWSHGPESFTARSVSGLHRGREATLLLLFSRFASCRAVVVPESLLGSACSFGARARGRSRAESAARCSVVTWSERDATEACAGRQHNREADLTRLRAGVSGGSHGVLGEFERRCQLGNSVAG